MAKDIQISAQISETTRELMEKHVRRTGVKKGHLVEQAILHHLQALEEIPAEYITHPRIVVSRKTGEEMLRKAESAEPTPALRELLRDEDRALRQSDDRSGFQSGDEALDRFFLRYAGQNQFRNHLGVTYVAVEEGRILGFATVAPRHIEIEELPERVRKKLPRYPMPALGLVRLAVDKSAQSMGLGSQLLRFVLKLASKMSDDVGCAAVVVDAKPGAVEFYTKYGFAPFEPLEGHSDAHPRPTAMYLMMEIAAALTAH